MPHKMLDDKTLTTPPLLDNESSWEWSQSASLAETVAHHVKSVAGLSLALVAGTAVVTLGQGRCIWNPRLVSAAEAGVQPTPGYESFWSQANLRPVGTSGALGSELLEFEYETESSSGPIGLEEDIVFSPTVRAEVLVRLRLEDGGPWKISFLPGVVEEES
ncbi:MAG: hypothetical protein HY047_18785 [Acidobacteria bacterium]|nr:hypothetical protein [Acidobacteriota bacterium]